MILHIIARLHITVLTCVGLVMITILVKRRNVVLGIIFYTITTSLLIPSQRWTFRAACVCSKISHLKLTLLIYPLVRCAVDVHLCGEPCKLRDKKGCLGKCTKV